jgi:hypothetical protein
MQKSQRVPITIHQHYDYKDGTSFDKEDTYYNEALITYSTLGLKQFNNCDHVTLTWNMKRHSVSLVNKEKPEEWFLKATNHGFFDPPLVRDGSGSTPLGLLGRAWESMQPKLNSEANLPVFLKELSGFRQIFESAGSAVIDMLNRRFVKAAAGTKLNYEYGVKATMMDVFNFASSYSQFRAAVNNLNLNSGKPLVHHYSEEETVGELRSQVNNGYETFHYVYPEFIRKWTVTVKYSYKLNVTYPPTLINYLKYLGFDRPVSSLWEVIPYSFCIDWIVDMQGWLSSFDFNKLSCDITIEDACISQKSEYSFYGYTKENPGVAAVYTPANRQLGGYQYKRYARSRIYPYTLTNAINLPRLDNVSIRELVLGASLIAAR